MSRSGFHLIDTILVATEWEWKASEWRQENQKADENTGPSKKR